MNKYYLHELKKILLKYLFLALVIILHFYNFCVLFLKDISLKCFDDCVHQRVICFYSNGSQILGFQNSLGGQERIMNLGF